MKDLHRDPPRWKDSTDLLDPAERAVGHAVRCVRAVPPRPAPPLARVTTLLHSERTRQRPAWLLACAALVLGVATAASAAHLDLLPAWLTGVGKPGGATPARDRERVPRAKPRAAVPTATVPAPLPSPEVPPASPPSATPEAPRGGAAIPPAAMPSPPATAATSAARKVAMFAPTRPASRPASTAADLPAPPSTSAPAPVPPVAQPALDTPPTAPTPTPQPLPPPSLSVSSARSSPGASPLALQTERDPATYLTQAIRLLRAERAPSATLRLLDRHDHELAGHGFAHEALLLRVEALLALDRRAELLRLLDGASLTEVAAARALLVTRGELRAAARRCAEGIGDFDLVLARARQTDRQALVGRARCRQQLGDVAGMRADIERLRREFPGQALPADLGDYLR